MKKKSVYKPRTQKQIQHLSRAINKIDEQLLSSTIGLDKKISKVETKPIKVVYETVYFMTYDNGDNIDNQPSMSYDLAKCGKCNFEIYHRDYKYCPHCGNLFDWGKWNERLQTKNTKTNPAFIKSNQ